MANRRSLQALTRHCPSIFSSNTSLRTFTTRPSLQPLSSPDPLSLSNPNHSLLPVFRTPFGYQYNSIRRFSIRDKFFGKNRNRDEEEEEEVDLGEGEEDDDDDEDEEDESDDEEEEEGERVSNANISRTYSVEEKAEEAAAIGYKVLGPLDPTERPFKWREPVFAVVQIGSHQFKVSNGDYIYAERLKFCEVNDKLLLSKVLMLGSQTQTIIGRPTLPEASVYAVVEEHALDAKVIIFKKKRRKNYRRTKGHRQELTRLRITDIQGVEKPVKLEKPAKPVRVRQPQPEMEAVPA